MCIISYMSPITVTFTRSNPQYAPKTLHCQLYRLIPSFNIPNRRFSSSMRLWVFIKHRTDWLSPIKERILKNRFCEPVQVNHWNDSTQKNAILQFTLIRFLIRTLLWNVCDYYNGYIDGTGLLCTQYTTYVMLITMT